MASFVARKVLSVSVGKLELKQKVGEHLDAYQGEFHKELTKAGYTKEQADRIVDSVLKQVFAFLAGKEAVADDEEKTA